MIILAIIFVLLLLLISWCSLNIFNIRQKYSDFYCPRFENFLFAHAKEVAKSNQSISNTFLQWSKESGDTAFVLFSSWRVHLHVVETTKIKSVLSSSSILKPSQSTIDSFCGVDVLGSKSLLTEPGTGTWLKKRKLCDPFFHSSGLRNSYQQLVDISSDLTSSIDIDQPTNLTKSIQKHVSFVIAQLVMNIKDKHEFFSYSEKISNVFSGLQIKMRNKNTFWIPWMFRDTKYSILQDLAAVRSYFKKHILSQNIEEVNLSSSFGALLQANVVADQLLVNELINDMTMFFFAGIDTSMHTINFAFYELLRNKHILVALEKEISEVFGDQESLSYQEVKGLGYLDKFIREVLRLHPIVSTVTRTSGPTGFNLLGQHVPKNTNVHVNIECVQKSARYWKEPLKFDVDRWNVAHEPFSYIPFSGGIRGCIGKQLALLEIKVFICSILHSFTIDYENTKVNDISTSQVLTNRLSKDLQIKFKKRSFQSTF